MSAGSSLRLFSTCLVALLLVLQFTCAAAAPDITVIKKFSALNGEAYFLPGAWIYVWEKKSTYYQFKDGRFVEAKELPDTLKGFKPFSSGQIDFLNQIARADFDPSITAFLPKEARVKRVIELPLDLKQKKYLVLACFTAKTSESYPMHPDDTDLYLSAMTHVSTGDIRTETYQTLWSKKLVSEASYGDLSVQKVGALGQFLVLYWGQPTGDSSLFGLDVYRINLD